VASRWPQRFSLAAFMSRSTSASVRYSRRRRVALGGRLGPTVRFTVAGMTSLRWRCFTNRDDCGRGPQWRPDVAVCEVIGGEDPAGRTLADRPLVQGSLNATSEFPWPTRQDSKNSTRSHCHPQIVATDTPKRSARSAFVAPCAHMRPAISALLGRIECVMPAAGIAHCALLINRVAPGRRTLAASA
jgi:hypothetical protein